MERWLFNQVALQEYVLICAQDRRGGLCDKPGKSRDFYHTCYGLSGLSIAQHFGGGNIAHKIIVGDKSNELVSIDMQELKRCTVQYKRHICY